MKQPQKADRLHSQLKEAIGACGLSERELGRRLAKESKTLDNASIKIVHSWKKQLPKQFETMVDLLEVLGYTIEINRE